MRSGGHHYNFLGNKLTKFSVVETEKANKGSAVPQI